jgi:hypothetical protein
VNALKDGQIGIIRNREKERDCQETADKRKEIIAT